METVVIVTPTEDTNRYGDTELGWDAAARVTVQAIVYPSSSSEDNENRAALVSGLTILFPSESAPSLTHRDRVEARGQTWEVDGDLGDWRSPWGWRPGHEVRLRRVQG